VFKLTATLQQTTIPPLVDKTVRTQSNQMAAIGRPRIDVTWIVAERRGHVD